MFKTLGAALLLSASIYGVASAQDAPARPNILVIFGDDIGQTNLSIYSRGLMGYRTPNIDRIGKEGAVFTDYYAEQSCTAGRSTFITGQTTLIAGLESTLSAAWAAIAASLLPNSTARRGSWSQPSRGPRYSS